MRRTGVAKRSETTDLGLLADALADGVGEHHLCEMAEALGGMVGADLVLIGQVTGASGDQVETLALYRDGKILENTHYHLKHTPCETILSGRVCVYRSGVRESFPHDRELARMGAESYAGMPLVDSLGRVLGLISVVSRRRIRNEARVTALLRIFGARVALEVERIVMDESMMRQVMAGLSDG